MTAVAPTLPATPDARVSHSALGWAVRDTLTVTRRNLLRYTRVPELLVFTFVQPVMFVLLFRYVFGGAIPTGSVAYVDYLMPGIFVQTVVFGSVSTGIGLAEDLQTGIVDRFRSLPMARVAVLGGRTLADLVRNTFVVALMMVVGLLVGFRPGGSIPAILLGCLVVLATSFALSWAFASIGLRSGNAEAAQAISFPILFPLTFASSAFVPVSTMPDWLQTFALHQPITIIINATRSLMLGPADTKTMQQLDLIQGSTGKNLLVATLWIVGSIAVFAPLAVRRYRKVV
jgi:ABC-2 type transport system permease protein/oleandomycin transport system permease protein